MGFSAMDSGDLRDTMVNRLLADHAAKGLRMRPEVERALRTVPRELYTPGVSPEEAYADTAVVTKRRGEETTSSVSAPWLIAEMLGQAADALNDGLQGKRVLEIGSGGYNASLLRELVGPLGSVTTMDIDSDVTKRAKKCLATAGYPDVTVICADAEQPLEPPQHFDLVIVTAGSWDVPPAWIRQLTEGGVLVVPLRTFGMTRSWALRRVGYQLISHSQRLCGFVAMQGKGAHEIRYVDLADGVHLRLDENQCLDPAPTGVLQNYPPVRRWAGINLPPQTMLADLDLWLATNLTPIVEHFVVLSAQQEAVDTELVTPAWRFGTPAFLDGGTFCYRSQLRWDGGLFDLGACAHGPDAAKMADQIVKHMRNWVESGCPAPTLRVLGTNTPVCDLPDGSVLNRRHSRLIIAFTTI